jgi:hypothetical protein
MTKTRLAGSLMMAASIIFFVAGAIRSENRAVNIALGVVFLILAINVKKRKDED